MRPPADTSKWQAEADQLTQWLEARYKATHRKSTLGLLARHFIASFSGIMLFDFTGHTVRDMMLQDMPESSLNGRDRQLAYSRMFAQKAGTTALQKAYEERDLAAASLLSQLYFRAGVQEVGGKWEVVQPEALIRAFQWEALVNEQKIPPIYIPGKQELPQVSIFGGHPQQERQAILDTLPYEEIEKIEAARQQWLAKFAQE